MVPVRKTASEVAATEAAAMVAPPVKVTKTGLRLESKRATKELAALPLAAGKAAPGVATSNPEEVVPVTYILPDGSSAMARPMSPFAPSWVWARMLVAEESVSSSRTPSFWSMSR